MAIVNIGARAHLDAGRTCLTQHNLSEPVRVWFQPNQSEPNLLVVSDLTVPGFVNAIDRLGMRDETRCFP